MIKKFNHPHYEVLPQLVAEAEFLVIGEIHGISENADIILAVLKTIIKTKRPVTIVFEWNLNTEQLIALQKYVTAGKKLSNIPYFISDSDGRCVNKHITLLQHCLEINKTQPNMVNIDIFDSSDINREKQMANNILSLHKNDNRLFIVETGVYHARKNNKEKVMVDYLSEAKKTITAFIEYETGTAWVEDRAHSVNNSFQQHLGPRTDFDILISIQQATHCSPKKTLTAFRQKYILENARVGNI